LITRKAQRAGIAAASCGALALAGLAAAPTASAAVAPAVRCIWNPTANSKVGAKYTGTNVNIRTGPSTSCTAIGEGQPGDTVYVHCYYWDPSTAVIWDYLTDYTRGKKGWSDGFYVDQGPSSVTPC
jgi:hypothetical protein